MKKLTWMLLFAVLFQYCTQKKTETVSKVDSVSVDSVVISSPAPTLLAYNPIAGFSQDSKLGLSDTVNYFLFNSKDELVKKFSSSGSTEVNDMDFVINFIVGVACMPTADLTTIVMDRVELGTESIDVYLTIRRGEKQESLTNPAQVFAIEKRNGYSSLQFFVNGKKAKSLLLPMN